MAHKRPRKQTQNPSSSLAPAPDDSVAITDVNDAPPSYTGPSLSSPQMTTPASSGTLSHIIPVDFSLYKIPGASISRDRLTVTVHDPRYASDAQMLLDLILLQSKLPPHPQIRITGEDPSKPFDFKISMMQYIVRPPTANARNSWNYVKLLGDGELGWRGGKEQSKGPAAAANLQTWAQIFAEVDNKAKKCFTLNKQVTNWNTDFLEGQIRNLIASVDYDGPVKVTFPVTHSRLVIQPKPNRQWHEKIAAIFQPSLVKRYEVITAVWPFAALSPDDARGQGNEWAVQSETQIWAEWKDVIVAAIQSKRTGWLSLEDRMDWAMGDGWATREAEW